MTGAFSGKSFVHIIQIAESLPVHIQKNVPKEDAAHIRRPAGLDMHHQQTCSDINTCFLLKRFGNLNRLHHEADIRPHRVPSRSNFVGDT